MLFVLVDKNDRTHEIEELDYFCPICQIDVPPVRSFFLLFTHERISYLPCHNWQEARNFSYRVANPLARMNGKKYSQIHAIIAVCNRWFATALNFNRIVVGWLATYRWRSRWHLIDRQIGKHWMQINLEPNVLFDWSYSRLSIIHFTVNAC